jgi:two-component system cell cycle response regulator DivK
LGRRHRAQVARAPPRQKPDAARFERIKKAPRPAEILEAHLCAFPMSKDKPNPAPLAANRPRARILVVEDNPLNRLLVHDLLELRGHEVIEAATVDEARLLLDARPDLLLLDVQIPGGGGEAVIREVRQRPHLADLPIIAVTSLAMPGDRERLLGIGFQGYLSKPIDTRTFGVAIESFLKSAEGAVHVRQAG